MYDTVIVGAGHNGLVAAWYLAVAGRRVVVLERRALVGGACTTEEIAPGIRCSTTSYVCSMLHPAVIEDLDLRRRGFEVLPASASFVPLPDGRHLLLGLGSERDRESIAQFSAKDAEAFPRFEEALARAAGFLRPMLDLTPPALGRPSFALMRDGGRMVRRFNRLSQADRRMVGKALTMSAADFLSEWFESPVVLGALGAGGTVGIPGSPMTPGTAFVLLHYALGDVAGGPGSWGHVRGGMGALTQAMADACREVGVEIRTSAEVSEIIVDGGRARGAMTADGERISARAVLSNADPKRTFERLVPGHRQPADFRKAIADYRTTGTSGKLNLALSGVPSFAALPGDGEHLTGLVQVVGEGLPYLERAYEDFKRGEISREPYLDISIPSLVDDSLAPEGTHVMSISMKYAPYAHTSGDRERQREQLAERVLTTLERYAPGFSDLITARQIISPYDLEREFGLTGGNVVHGDMSIDQLFAMRPVLGYGDYRTPIDGLYLCGSGTHPGGGVSGASGRNAALAVLRAEKGFRRRALGRRREAA